MGLRLVNAEMKVICLLYYYTSDAAIIVVGVCYITRYYLLLMYTLYQYDIVRE